MHSVLILLAMLLTILLAFFHVSFATAGTDTDTLLGLADDRGRNIRLHHAAQRIVSLYPSITELVFAAGAGSRLVGVDSYSDYPPAVKSIAGVGDSFGLDLERIVALKPDLVIAWRSGNVVADVEKLEKLGLTVFVIEASRLKDIPRILRVIGKLAGTSTQAELAASAYESALQQIRRDYAGSQKEKVSVFQLIWHQPLMTVNGNHMISDIIALCGGVNVFAAMPSLTPVISAESLLAADPQAIIVSVSLESAAAEMRQWWQQFSHIRAVKNKHLFLVNPDLLHRQTPRVLQAAKSVCEQMETARKQSAGSL